MAELHDIRGIGPATAVLLADHRLTSVKKLAKADLAAIIAVPGFGPVRAAAVQAEARAAASVKPAKPPKASKPKPAKSPKAKADKQKTAKAPKAKKKSPKAKKKAKKG